jgi:hypothetical protein
MTATEEGSGDGNKGEGGKSDGNGAKQTAPPW